MRSEQEIRKQLNKFYQEVSEPDGEDTITKSQARYDMYLMLSWVLKVPVPGAPWTDQ